MRRAYKLKVNAESPKITHRWKTPIFVPFRTCGLGKNLMFRLSCGRSEHTSIEAVVANVWCGDVGGRGGGGG